MRSRTTPLLTLTALLALPAHLFAQTPPPPGSIPAVPNLLPPLPDQPAPIQVPGTAPATPPVGEFPPISPPPPGQPLQVTPPPGPSPATGPAASPPAAGPRLTDLVPPDLGTSPSLAPTPSPAPAAGTALGRLSATESLTGFGGTFAFAAPEILGDAFGVGILQRVPPVPNPPPIPPQPGIPPVPGRGTWNTDVATAAIVPSIRSIKICENQSPIPADRILYSFNYYNQVNYAINRQFNAPISDINIYRHVFGFEKTFWDRRASFGLRPAINTVNANSPIPGVGQQSTAINQLNLFVKYALWQNEDRSRLISGGLSIGAPTGPGSFAGARWLTDQNPTFLQPFLGLYYYQNRFFFQGFSSIEVPLDANAPTMLYNDYAVGYLIYQNEDPDAWLSGLAPVFEIHVNTPLNHRGVTYSDPWSVPDFVNFTYGTTFLFGKRTRLLTGLATPVTGPRIFDFEAMAMLNIYF